jgi:hypothetical protein
VRDKKFRPGPHSVGHAKEEKVLFYPVWVSNHAPSSHGTSLYWGKPCDRAGVAAAAAQKEIDEGRATMAFVVRFGDGKKSILPTYVIPNRERVAIRHFLELLDKTGGYVVDGKC